MLPARVIHRSPAGRFNPNNGRSVCAQCGVGKANQQLGQFDCADCGQVPAYLS
jgi:hypothetical protein